MPFDTRLTAAAVALGSIVVVVGAGILVKDVGYSTRRSEHLLSQTGLFVDVAKRVIADGVMEFAPQYPLWSDGASKHRYVFLPPNAQIDTRDPDRWNFPAGTRLWKEFERDGVVVETRMLLKVGPARDEWDMSVYLWRPSRADADKITSPRPNANGTPHDVPGPKTCSSCHGGGAERRPLGFTSIQLPWTDSSKVSMTSLAADGRLSNPPPMAPIVPGSAEIRAALGYLHANCGSCHYTKAASASSSPRLRMGLTTAMLGSPEQTDTYRTAIGRRPEVSGLGTTVYVAPGNPPASLLWRRMRIRDESGWQMPPVATNEVDAAGVAIVQRWIEALPAVASTVR